jgi:hypothetical protein
VSAFTLGDQVVITRPGWENSRAGTVVEVHDYSTAPAAWDVTGPDRCLYDVDLVPVDRFAAPARVGVPLRADELQAMPTAVTA